MEVDKSTIIIIILSILMIINASIHFASSQLNNSAGSSIITYCNYIDDQLNNSTNPEYTNKLPYFAYLFTIGSFIFIFVGLNCITFFINPQKPNPQLAIITWFSNWLLVGFNFAAGVIVAFFVSF